MDYHQAVLLKETIELLAVSPGHNYLDATLGNGGHTLEILKLGGIVYGIDQDPQNLALATDRINSLGFQNSFFPIHGNFNNLASILDKIPKVEFSGAVFDLGLSSSQLKSEGRGFSFNDAFSLDMRLDPASQDLTAENIINTYSYEELFRLFSTLAQEKFSKPLAIKIIKARQQEPIRTAQRLAQIIRNFYQDKGIRSHIDPATKIFMALRMEVNDELDNLKNVLSFLLRHPQFSGSVVAIITFHSGEDRIVKQFIRSESQSGKILVNTPHAIAPSTEEISSNPLSRSSKLRSFKINT